MDIIQRSRGTEIDIEEMSERYRAGMTIRELAAEYGVGINGITHLLLLQIRLERPIMIPLAAPPFLDQLEWRRRSLLYIHVPQDKGAPLIVNRLAHGLYDSRVW